MNTAKNLRFIFNHAFTLLLITFTVHVSIAQDQNNNNFSEVEAVFLLMEAIDRGDLEVVLSLVEEAADAGLDIIAFSNELITWDMDVELDHPRYKYFWQTHLTLAAQEGHMPIVRYLVEEAEVSIDLIDRNGYTALMHAVDHIDIVKYLVEAGADINLTNRGYGRTAFMYAAWGCNIDVVKYLFEESGQQIDLSLRERYGGASSILYMEDKMLASKTALDVAAWSGCIDVVRYLIEKGADSNSQNRLGLTAVMYAAYNGKINVVRYFAEEAGADIHREDKRGNTAQTHAIRGGHTDVANYLLSLAGGTRSFLCRNLSIFCY